MNDTREYKEIINLFGIGIAIIKKWWLILIMMTLCGTISYYVTVNYVTSLYSATATLFIGKDSQGFGDINLSDLSLDSKLVSDYRELIKTRLVTDQVVEELALITSRGSLLRNLSISLAGDSRFMYVTFVDPLPDRAKIITNSLAEVLASEAERIVGVKNVQIVDYALTPDYPFSPSVRRNVAIAAFLGMIIAIGLVLLDLLFDNSIKTEIDIEHNSNLVVLGVIPIFKGEAK